jgi:hypothetical protein
VLGVRRRGMVRFVAGTIDACRSLCWPVAGCVCNLQASYSTAFPLLRGPCAVCRLAPHAWLPIDRLVFVSIKQLVHCLDVGSSI